MNDQKIEKIGGFLEVDQNGFLINTTDIDKINPDWREGVDEVVEVYKKHFGYTLHSVYIRGSVAKGKAIADISDIDSIAVVDLPRKDIERSWVKEFKEQFEKKFSFISDVEINIQPLQDLSKSTKLMIQSQSACVFGEDLTKKIDPFKIGIDTVQHAQGLPLDIDWVKKYFDQEDRSEEQIRQKCTWIMKRILRTACELVMERSGRYTRDLYPCYEIFTEYYPDQAEQMREVLQLAVFPTGDQEKVVQILNDIGFWMKKEIEDIFGKDFIEKE